MMALLLQHHHQQQQDPQQIKRRRTAAHAFKQWILSLSWTELTVAAQIPLTADDESVVREMVAAQVPPETPIHPRACPTSSYVFDGRSPAQRKQHRRKHTPRLLTWVNQASYLNASLQSRTKRRTMSRQQQQQTPQVPAAYSVTAKGLIQRDGERWSIPPTQALRDADQQMLYSLVVKPVGKQNSVANLAATDANGPVESVLCWDASSLVLFPSTNQIDDHDDDNDEVDCRVKHLYHLWRKASRGNFGTSGGQCTKQFTADWLDPTERWFSLGMFLAARLEYTLYRQFLLLQPRDDDNKETTTCLVLPPLVPTGHCYDARTWQKAMISVLAQDAASMDNNNKWNARKSALWNLLDEGMAVQTEDHSNLTRNSVKDCYYYGSQQCVLPLLKMDSAMGRLWKELRRVDREMEAQRVEQELLGDLEDEATVKTSTRKTTQKTKSSRKKKKKKGNRNPPSSVVPENVTEIQVRESSETSDADEHFIFYPGTIPRDDKMISREQNRNMVLALGVLDDILDRVFDQVGLGKGINETDQGLVPVGTKAPVVKQTRFMKTKSIIPVPSRQTVHHETSEVIRQKARPVSKTTKDSSGATSARMEPTFRSARPDEIPRNGPTTETKDRDSTWPFYQNDFLPYPSSGFDGVMPKGADTGDRPFQGLAGSTNSYNAFVGPTTWFRQEPSEAPLWEPHNFVTLNQWRTLQGLGGRDRSIMEEFFRTQRERELAKDESQMASSTIASIASSAEDVDVRVGDVMEVLEETPLLDDDIDEDDDIKPDTDDDERFSPKIRISESGRKTEEQLEIAVRGSRSSDTITSVSGSFGSRSPSPQAPKTPSPTLSPILVSLEDLRGLRKEVIVVQKEKDRDSSSHNPSVRSFSSVPVGAGAAGSLPNSPQETKLGITSTLSRENLRSALSDDRETNARTTKRSPSAVSDAEATPRGIIPNRHVKMKSQDDTEIRPRGYVRKATDALDSYRNAAARSLKSRDDEDVRHGRSAPLRHASYKGMNGSAPNRQHEQPRVFGPLPFDASETAINGDRCTRSELGQEDYVLLHESRRSMAVDEGDNNTVTRDGSTTITSALSQRETEESLREERDTYRDLCLTLGAEVASLKNLLAAYRGATSYTSFGNNGEFPHTNGPYQFFDPDSVSHVVQRYSRQRTVAAMSDAGFRGEHESMASEDEFTRDKGSVAQRAQQISATATVGGSDISVEQSVRHETVPVAVPTLRNSYFQTPIGGFQSRLGRDILQFVDSINTQLQKQDTRRAKAVERMTRLVTAVWPRAQVKTYGSHVTGLCLPSSDVDFVICLPAVHKNAPAVAPGALEGRNAINETSQKLLARKLKSESWIDTRSMQLIDRTVVPVIKVSTKDTKARSVHLDITFDSPNHHGVEAVDMVTDIMQELPMLRPLVLVLKSFLDDKNLLSAYKGGLSSYCLFLMTARYLQEQSTSWGDCGSLLMGFLDFYGNHFNARTTGISVRNRLYFARPNYSPGMQAQPIWPPQVVPPHHMHSLPNGNDKSFARRNSFNDKGGIDGVRGTTTTIDKNERYPTVGFQPMTTNMDPNQFNHGMTCTFEFDPLFVEDPLSPGNNVGRNAFRFPQIQRSFSDAHRALLAALEWELESTEELQDGTEYPLLKSLLRSEDVVCDL